MFVKIFLSLVLSRGGAVRRILECESRSLCDLHVAACMY